MQTSVAFTCMHVHVRARNRRCNTLEQDHLSQCPDIVPPGEEGGCGNEEQGDDIAEQQLLTKLEHLALDGGETCSSP